MSPLVLPTTGPLTRALLLYRRRRFHAGAQHQGGRAERRHDQANDQQPTCTREGTQPPRPWRRRRLLLRDEAARFAEERQILVGRREVREQLVVVRTRSPVLADGCGSARPPGERQRSSRIAAQ